MGVSTSYNGTVPVYRCPRTTSGDCPTRVTIGAEIVEGIVVDAVRARIADVEGRASAEPRRPRGRARAGTRPGRSRRRDPHARGLRGRGRGPRTTGRAPRRTRCRPGAGRPARRPARLRRPQRFGDDWDRLSLDGRRALIRAAVDRVGRRARPRRRPRHGRAARRVVAAPRRRGFAPPRRGRRAAGCSSVGPLASYGEAGWRSV